MRTFFPSGQTANLDDRQFLRQLIKCRYILLVAVAVVEDAVIRGKAYIPELVLDSLQSEEKRTRHKLRGRDYAKIYATYAFSGGVLAKTSTFGEVAESLLLNQF